MPRANREQLSVEDECNYLANSSMVIVGNPNLLGCIVGQDE